LLPSLACKIINHFSVLKCFPITSKVINKHTIYRVSQWRKYFQICFIFFRLRRKVKAASDVDYPAYGVTGPTKERIPSPGDRKLAQSAQMYHYQHQKQQMIAMEKYVVPLFCKLMYQQNFWNDVRWFDKCRKARYVKHCMCLKSQQNQYSDWPKWLCTSWHNINSCLLSDITSFHMFWHADCQYSLVYIDMC